MSRWKWKGKGRALDVEDDYSDPTRRDPGSQEGSGGAAGIVLPLDMVGGGIYDVAYTLPVKFGSKSQQFSLQVDTGSSDLWVASTSCSTSSCKATQGRLYDPSGSRSTGQDFSIPYLSGSAAGPIVWDKVEIGGYSIDNQALSAATDVQNEPLSSKFSGILGLALPLNSIIANTIPPVTSNDPDGAAWASNLFSITPTSLAPSARFLSLSLARPGSDRIPSLLGIGLHPSSLVPDPGKVKYSTLVGDRSGVLFWKVSVRAITVYVGGERKEVSIGRSNTGAVFPSAVVDSGVPYILTTSSVANAIYGAIGISPGKDGMYYVPCTTPLNLTFTIDDRPEIPIHPLDLTAEPADDNQASFCVGLIQTADAQLSAHDSTIGDMILGVPFMRNVYTVMAYTTPNTDGSFPTLTGGGTDGGVALAAAQVIRPRLGLMSLTDPTVALGEFNTVRVLNQPITSSGGGGTSSGSSGSSGSNTGSDANTKTVDVGGTKLSVGIIVLIGLLSFFGVCLALFGVRWCIMRRKYRRSLVKGAGDEAEFNGMSLDQKAAFTLVRSGMAGSFAKRGDDGVHTGLGMSEDELRELRFKSYLRKEKQGLSLVPSESTVDSERTGGDEFGRLRGRRDLDMEDTLVVRTDVQRNKTYGGDEEDDGIQADTPLVSNMERRTSAPSSPLHQHHDSFYADADSPPAPSPHKNMPSIDQPLLLSSHQNNGSGEYIPRQYTLDDTRPHVMETELDGETDDLGELGFVNGVSMAGVGSAARTSKLSSLSSLSSVPSRYSTMSEEGQEVHAMAIRESGVLNSPVGATRTPVAASFNNQGSAGSAAAVPVNFSMPLRSRSGDVIS